MEYSPYLRQPLRTLEEYMADKTPQSTGDPLLAFAEATEAQVSKVLMDIADHSARIDGIKSQIDKLAARKKSAEAAIESRRKALATWMVAGNHKTAKLPEATLSLGKGKQKLMVLDEDKLPLDCFETVTTTKLNKKMVEAKLLTGERLEGATLSNAEPVLSIRF